MPIKINITNNDGLERVAGTLLTDSLNGYHLVPTGAASDFEDRVKDVVGPDIDEINTGLADIGNTINETHTSILDHLGDNYVSNILYEADKEAFATTASVEEYYGAHVTNEAASAIWGMDVNAGGATSGIELGAYDPENGDGVSYVKIAADIFAVYSEEGNTQVDPITGADIPVFSVFTDPDDGSNQLRFNGKAVFGNMIDGQGATIIEDGYIKTDVLDVKKIITGHSGEYLGKFLDPPTDLDFANLDPTHELFNRVIKNGDTYLEQHDGRYYEYTDGVWSIVSPEEIYSATAELNLMAVNLGYADYNDMKASVRDTGTTIIEGGLIQAELIEANAVVLGAGKGNVDLGDGFSVAPTNSYFQTLSDDDPLYGYTMREGDTYRNINGREYRLASDLTTWNTIGAGYAAAVASNAEITAKDNVAYQLGYSSYSNMVSNARNSGKTIIQGGWLNTSVIEAEAIKATYIDVDDLFAKNITATGSITGAEIYGAYGSFTKPLGTSGSTISASGGQRGIYASGTVAGGHFLSSSSTNAAVYAANTSTGYSIYATDKALFGHKIYLGATGVYLTPITFNGNPWIGMYLPSHGNTYPLATI